MTQASQNVAGVILAGGLARRMGGGDKCLLELGGKTLLQHTIDRARPQLSALVLNVNGDPLRFALSGLAVVADQLANNMGPLAGIHAGLKWMRENTAHLWLASFACDSPFFPLDMVEKLFAQIQADSEVIVARTDQQTHSVFALWHISLLEKIAEQLASGKVPRLQDWIQQQHCAYVTFDTTAGDCFFNINTPEDLAAAEAIWAATH